MPRRQQSARMEPPEDRGGELGKAAVFSCDSMPATEPSSMPYVAVVPREKLDSHRAAADPRAPLSCCWRRFRTCYGHAERGAIGVSRAATSGYLLRPAV